ncbi:hypothetical protein ACET3Z_032277 [Daucus carota]
MNTFTCLLCDLCLTKISFILHRYGFRGGGVCKKNCKRLKASTSICNTDCSIYSIKPPFLKLTESYEGQDMYTGEKIVLVKDLNNFESDPEEFARSFCKDVGIDDPEVGSSFWPAIAFAIWEHIYKIAVQNVFSARESRISTKGRRGFEHSLPSSRFILISVRLVALHWI